MGIGAAFALIPTESTNEDQSNEIQTESDPPKSHSISLSDGISVKSGG